MSENCRSCGAEIDWAVKEPTVENPRIVSNPINHDSADDPKGNLAVWRANGGILRFRNLHKGESPAPGEHRAISHFATCPNAGEHRRKQPAWNSATDIP